MRGGERCLEAFLEIFPEADIYTAFCNPGEMTPIIRERNIQSSFLNELPRSQSYHRYLLPVYPRAAKSLGRKLQKAHDKEKYDLVISISHCLAKNVPVPKGVFHLCYCLTPMRYLWDQYDNYFGKRKIEPIARQVVRGLRQWDVAGIDNVDAFVGISHFVAERIKRVYRRDASVIYPPVRSDWITPRTKQEKGTSFLCASAFVPYKRIDAVVEAFNLLPDERLLVVGDGPEARRLRNLAGDNVAFLGRVSDQRLAQLYRSSRALLFAAEEDFGMIPVEMQAAGRPVICLGKGGALETVVNSRENGTGIYFDECTPEAIRRAIDEFSVLESNFTVDNCIKHAKKFGPDVFREQLAHVLVEHGVLAGNAKEALATV
jgi:glycosyltransferase involved in cell wall biosynthesis